MVNTLQHIILCGLGLPCVSISFLLKELIDEMSSEVIHVICSILSICLCNLAFSSITFSEIDKNTSFFLLPGEIKNEIMNTLFVLEKNFLPAAEDVCMCHSRDP